MVELDPFANLSLRGGFLLQGVRVAVVPMTDAVGRPALARTEIVGHHLNIELAAGLPAAEISVSLYHEVLEAAAVATSHPPGSGDGVERSRLRGRRPKDARGPRHGHARHAEPDVGAF